MGNLFKEGTHLPEFETIDSLFTKRNLYALVAASSIEIEKIEDRKTAGRFQVCVHVDGSSGKPDVSRGERRRAKGIGAR